MCDLCKDLLPVILINGYTKFTLISTLYIVGDRIESVSTLYAYKKGFSLLQKQVFASDSSNM